jgi:hypothetical protein
MFLSRIFSFLSPYQGQKLCFLTFLNIKSDFPRPYFIKPDCCPQSRGFYGDFFAASKGSTVLLCALPNVLIQDFFYPEVLTP